MSRPKVLIACAAEFAACHVFIGTLRFLHSDNAGSRVGFLNGRIPSGLHAGARTGPVTRPKSDWADPGGAGSDC